MVINVISAGVVHYVPRLPCNSKCKLPYFHFSFPLVLLRSAHYFTLPSRIWICLPYTPCFTLIFELHHPRTSSMTDCFSPVIVSIVLKTSHYMRFAILTTLAFEEM